MQRFAVVAVVILICHVYCLGQRERFFAFNGTDGAYPESGLVADSVGNFYGVTAFGGSNNVGLVYEISPTGNTAIETILYEFTASTGCYPISNLIFDSAGNLYGTTSGCGTFSQGTVFEVSPPIQPLGAWTENVIYTFTGGADGAEPQSGLTMSAGGNLYGTTYLGGQAGLGTVFELDANHNLTVLHAFTGYPTDGSRPVAAVALDGVGNLYGTTDTGGTYDGGTVFELSPSNGAWAESIFHSFGLEGDGASPQAQVAIGESGALVGTTIVGGDAGPNCGTVYSVGPPLDRHYEILHSFGVGTDGCNVLGSLVQGPNNVLYGTTQFGGLNAGQGTVFQLAHSASGWSESIFFSFDGSDGAVPFSGVTLYRNAFYGTTQRGGYTKLCGEIGCGTVFRLSR
jgi:uncharacterized repeat protein (TIGR03803 family)